MRVPLNLLCTVLFLMIVESFRAASDEGCGCSCVSRFSVVSGPKSASCDVNLCSDVSDREGENDCVKLQNVFFRFIVSSVVGSPRQDSRTSS